MLATAWLVPPAPFAIRVYVVEADGVTEREPEDGTTPRPSMVMSVALLVFQFKTADWPCWMLLGAADKVAVGAGGGSGGVAGCATFASFLLLHATRRKAAVNIRIRREDLRLTMGSSSEANSPLFAFELCSSFARPPRTECRKTASHRQQADFFEEEVNSGEQRHAAGLRTLSFSGRAMNLQK